MVFVYFKKKLISKNYIRVQDVYNKWIIKFVNIYIRMHYLYSEIVFFI